MQVEHYLELTQKLGIERGQLAKSFRCEMGIIDPYKGEPNKDVGITITPPPLPDMTYMNPKTSQQCRERLLGIKRKKQ